MLLKSVDEFMITDSHGFPGFLFKKQISVCCLHSIIRPKIDPLVFI